MARDLLPYAGLSPELEAALVTLETATQYAEAAESYRLVRAEADRRAPLMLGLVLPALALGGALVWGVQALGWLPQDASWAYGIGPILFVALVMWPVRGQAARDDTRIGKALDRWRDEATRAG